MTEDMEAVLRRSLDEIDRTRKRQWLLLILSFCALALFLLGVAGTARHVGDHRLLGQVMGSVVVSVLTNILVVVVLGMFITRMTKKILKAIELVSRK
jgi:uncharacterized membrane protein